jgi:hypothetical protein
MNIVFLFLLILFFLYIISLLNNNNIEKFVNILPMIYHDTETCTSQQQTYGSSTNPKITGCESNYCSNEPKGGSYDLSIKKCYAKGGSNTKCITANTCNNGLVCNRFNNDTSVDAAGATPKYCLSTNNKCNYNNKNNRASQCLLGKRCNDKNNCVNN